MKHAFRHILLLLCGALLAVGCSKKTIIPDDDLERITREMFLANAYAATEKVATDSLDIYTPILVRYGYSQDDFFNTLANFQKRKSARYSDIVEAAIKNLEGLSSGYERKLRELRYVDSLAKSMLRKEVLFVERVKVTRFKDTTRLKLTIPVRDEGEYIVSYNYLIDSLDKNLRLQSNHAVYDAQGERNYIMRNNLTRYVRKSYTTTIFPKKGSTTYVLSLADYAKREDEPYIIFDSIRVVYLPPVDEALAHMDSLMRFRPGIMDNDTIRARGYLDAKPPRLPHDTVWVAIDSLDLAEATLLKGRADSLTGRADEVAKEVKKLLAKSEKLHTAAAKKWYRNDSLRAVAHAKNLAEAEKLTRKADSLTLVGDTLRQRAEVLTLRGDSLETVVLGAPREKTTTK
ncbi:MAG: DUF4296 domain-containing protein [Tidjanibacter sp.]|nr:DUF4296 domain-containing protein [Tidjanibacter sp.]